MGHKEMRVLIMAGGTGGHIFPALSIAEKLQACGAHVEWLGSDVGMEKEILGKTAIPLHLISARGLRGKEWLSLLLAPLMILRATAQASQIIRAVNPDCVLGMGGFVTGPGGVAARLQRRKLLIHEQNAVPGLTNRLLASLAHRVLEAFPDTFAASVGAEMVGNPVRRSVAAVGRDRHPDGAGPLRILVLGGSQGAQAINKVIPAVLANWPEGARPEILHQAGKSKLEETELGYKSHNVSTGEQTRVVEFIDDMAAAYQWANFVICRSGASTVAEIAAAGLPAILIPYPHHKDRQQLKNARWLADKGAALIFEQGLLTAEGLAAELVNLDRDRARLKSMSTAALSLAITDADERIATRCLEAVDD